MNTTSYQSRWGYHPCEYELFLKIRRLHKWYWQTVYDFHRWHRWWRKEPQNRRGPEPAFCPLFVEDKTWFKPVCVHDEPGCKVYPKTVVDRDVVRLYQEARMPQAAPVPPFDEETVRRIEQLDASISDYLAK